MANLKKAWTYLVIAGVGILGALNYELFVFPNQFAPSGVNGICTIIQYVFNIRVSSLSLIINVPLAFLCFFKVSKHIAMRSMVYVLAFSLGLMLFDYMDLTMIVGTSAFEHVAVVKIAIKVGIVVPSGLFVRIIEYGGLGSLHGVGF